MIFGENKNSNYMFGLVVVFIFVFIVSLMVAPRVALYGGLGVIAIYLILDFIHSTLFG